MTASCGKTGKQHLSFLLATQGNTRAIMIFWSYDLKTIWLFITFPESKYEEVNFPHVTKLTSGKNKKIN